MDTGHMWLIPWNHIKRAMHKIANWQYDLGQLARIKPSAKLLTNEGNDYILVIRHLDSDNSFSLRSKSQDEVVRIPSGWIMEVDSLLNLFGCSPFLNPITRPEKYWGKPVQQLVFVGCDPNTDEEIKMQIATGKPPTKGDDMRLIFSQDNELAEIYLNPQIDKERLTKILEYLANYKAYCEQVKIRNKYKGIEPPNMCGHFAGQHNSPEELVNNLQTWLHLKVLRTTNN